MNERLNEWAKEIKNYYNKIPLRPKFKKFILVLLILFLLNELYWYRGNFHQVICQHQKLNEDEYGKDAEFYYIGTSPPFISLALGDLDLGPTGYKLKTHFALDTASKYEKEDIFKWSKNTFSSNGVLSLHKGDWSWTIGNITPQCWSGLKRYVGNLDIDHKPTLIEK